nr:uncharacterized protein LOC107456497 isoform X1 [Parasteatoda tepidariorum]
MLKCEVENLEKLESENVKLKEDIENLKLEIADLVRKNDELKSGMRTFGEMCVETTLDTCVEEKMQNAAVYTKEDYPKRSEIQRKNCGSVPSKMYNGNDNESSLFVKDKKHEQPVNENIMPMPHDDKKWDIKSSGRLEKVYDQKAKICDKRVIDLKPRARDLDSSGSEYLELVYDEQAKICGKRVIDPKPRARDLDSSGSECLEPVYDEQAKICDKRVIEPKPRARDLDSSGSECLELVYDEKSHEPIGLSTTGTKLGKNKLSATSNAEPKLLPFKTKRKREVQNVTQEDMVRRKFGLPPRKKMDNFHESPSLKPQLSKNLGKHHDFSNAKVRLENSPWKLTTDSPAPAQRKFFTKRSEERNTHKSSDTRKPWF